MRKRKKRFWLLLAGLVSFSAFIYTILNYSPDFQLSIVNFQFSVVAVFLCLLFFSLFFLSGFILNNQRRGALVGLYVIIYLILRLNSLTNPFFAILLLVLFGVIELFFVKRN